MHKQCMLHCACLLRSPIVISEVDSQNVCIVWHCPSFLHHSHPLQHHKPFSSTFCSLLGKLCFYYVNTHNQYSHYQYQNPFINALGSTSSPLAAQVHPCPIGNLREEASTCPCTGLSLPPWLVNVLYGTFVTFPGQCTGLSWLREWLEYAFHELFNYRNTLRLLIHSGLETLKVSRARAQICRIILFLLPWPEFLGWVHPLIFNSHAL